VSEVIYITPAEQRLARIKAKYAPRWGFDVPRAVEAMAKAKPAPVVVPSDRAIERDQDVQALVNDLAVEVKKLPAISRDTSEKFDGILEALQRSVAHRQLPTPPSRDMTVDGLTEQIKGTKTREHERDVDVPYGTDLI